MHHQLILKLRIIQSSSSLFYICNVSLSSVENLREEVLGVGCSTGLSVQVRKNNISSSFISLLSLLLYMVKIILLLKLIFLLFIILITPVWIADWREEAYQQHQQHQRVHYTALSIYIFIIYLPINLFIYYLPM